MLNTFQHILAVLWSCLDVTWQYQSWRVHSPYTKRPRHFSAHRGDKTWAQSLKLLVWLVPLHPGGWNLNVRIRSWKALEENEIADTKCTVWFGKAKPRAMSWAKNCSWISIGWLVLKHTWWNKEKTILFSCYVRWQGCKIPSGGHIYQLHLLRSSNAPYIYTMYDDHSPNGTFRGINMSDPNEL